MQCDPLFSVLKTLSYAEVFDFPMKFHELWKYLITKEKISKKSLQKILIKEKIMIKKKEGYYFLSNEKLIAERKERKKYSKEKMRKAIFAAGVLSHIPWIKFIGISGSLSVNNSKENDDIDFFIITEKKRLWITRFLVSLILKSMGRLRKRAQAYVKNRICPNFYLAFENLEIDRKKRNLFVAHEVAQLKVLANKESTYEKFMGSNLWINTYLANSINSDIFKFVKINTCPVSEDKIGFLLNCIEKLLFKLQFSYMRRHITSEVISSNIAMFHPVDQKTNILKIYMKKRSVYKKILNNMRENKNTMTKYSDKGYYGLLTY